MSTYHVSFETTIEVVNADAFTETEIEEALRRDFRREVEDNGFDSDRRYRVSQTRGRADYGLRLIRKSWGIDAQHPDDPIEEPA